MLWHWLSPGSGYFLLLLSSTVATAALHPLRLWAVRSQLWLLLRGGAVLGHRGHRDGRLVSLGNVEAGLGSACVVDQFGWSVWISGAGVSVPLTVLHTGACVACAAAWDWHPWSESGAWIYVSGGCILVWITVATLSAALLLTPASSALVTRQMPRAKRWSPGRWSSMVAQLWRGAGYVALETALFWILWWGCTRLIAKASGLAAVAAGSDPSTAALHCLIVATASTALASVGTNWVSVWATRSQLRRHVVELQPGHALQADVVTHRSDPRNTSLPTALSTVTSFITGRRRSRVHLGRSRAARVWATLFPAVPSTRVADGHYLGDLDDSLPRGDACLCGTDQCGACFAGAIPRTLYVTLHMCVTMGWSSWLHNLWTQATLTP